MLTFLLYFLGKISKIYSITERKKIEKNATASLIKYDPDTLILLIFFLSLQLNSSKNLLILRLLGVERVWCFRSSLCWYGFSSYTYTFSAHPHTFILYLSKFSGFTLNSIILHFFLPHFLFLPQRSEVAKEVFCKKKCS